MFPKEVIDQFKAHAITAFPDEACGLIVGESAVNCIFVACRNVAEKSVEDFKISGEDYLEAAQQGEVLAVMHTHVNSKDYPSGLDMENQMKTGVPWGIAVVSVDEASGKEPRCSEPFFFGDQVPVADLIGRPFRHGVWDCYSLVRDYFRVEKGIVFPDKPRDYEWWLHGHNLYLDYFKDTGFVMIDPEDAVPGDCVLMRIHPSPVPCHGGVYLEDGLFLHHLEGRLSRREPIHPWARKVSHWLRYEGEK